MVVTDPITIDKPTFCGTLFQDFNAPFKYEFFEASPLVLTQVLVK